MSSLRPRSVLVVPLLALLGLPVLLATPAGAVDVGTAGEFVTAFEDGSVTEITLTADLTLPPEPTRPLGAEPLVIEGDGFTLTGADGSRVLSAFNPVGALTVRNITITGGTPGGGQGAGIAWGGPVTVEDSLIT
ncbi:MAG: pectate lyase-like adhesive domain-containing protein, partial [Acidimicrobiales bacterium]